MKKKTQNLPQELLREIQEITALEKKLDKSSPRLRLFLERVGPFVTDEDLAEWLRVSARTIKNWRKEWGIKKTEIKRVHKEDIIEQSFVTSLQFKTIQDAFSEEEIDFYKNEWKELSVQFEDVLATEKRQIDQYIKSEIMANRVLRNIKIAENKILELQTMLAELYSKRDMSHDDDARDIEEALGRLNKLLQGTTRGMTREYQELMKTQSDILSDLNAKRRDRLDVIKSGKVKLHDLIAQFRDKSIREKEGKHIELIRISKEKKENEFRNLVRFPDGKMDAILLDAETPVALVEDDLDEVFSILVVENDITRIQWFQDWLERHEVTFADESSKAIKHLKEGRFDIICLDYDIKLTSSMEVADFVADNRSKVGRVLIHSNNEKGAEQLFNKLPDAILLPFDDLFKLNKPIKEILRG